MEAREKNPERHSPYSNSMGGLSKRINNTLGIAYLLTLDSGIDVGPTFINSGFFPGPTALLERGKVLFCGVFKN